VTALLVAALALASCASNTTTTTAPPATAGPATTQGVTTTVAQTPGAQSAFGGYPEGATCADCHNDSTVLASKQSQMKQRSVHGTGEAFEEGEGTACAGCHGTEGSKARINAGLPPHDKSVSAIETVSPMGCRT
jgi:cytochrome c553